MLQEYRIQLPDSEATDQLAAVLATCLPRQLCVWLEGELGSGKTHLVRGLLRALGCRGAVRSPTYTLLETYDVDAPQTVRAGVRAPSTGARQKLEAESGLVVYHFDLYRLASPEEWAEAGFDDLPDLAVRLIEWPQRGGAATPPADLRVGLAVAGRGRSATVIACSRIGEETCQTLGSALQAQPAGSALHWVSAC